MKKSFQKLFSLIAFTAVAVMCCQASTVHAQLVDDFSVDNLAAEYTSTVILDANGAGSNTSAFQITGGALELSTTVYDGIEQYAFIKNGLTLGVGEEVRADLPSAQSGNRAFGLYVGGTAPATGVRQDFISVYGQSNNGRVFQRGFDGTSEYTNLLLDPTAPNANYYFIARTGLNAFDVGFNDGTRQIVSSLTPTTANTADFVGFYADARATGTLGSLDNLRIVSAVPEPSSIAALGLAGLMGLVRRRRV